MTDNLASRHSAARPHSAAELKDSIARAAEALDELHLRLDGGSGCLTCWPGEDAWPCDTAIIAADLREMLTDVER